MALQQPILTHAHTKCPPVHLASFDLKKDNKDLQNLILETIKPKKADVSKVLNHLSTTCNSLSHLKAIRLCKENEDVASQLYI